MKTPPNILICSLIQFFPLLAVGSSIYDVKVAVGLQSEYSTFVFKIPLHRYKPSFQAIHEESDQNFISASTCSESEVVTLRKEFWNVSRLIDGTFCPKETWLRELSSSSASRNKIIVNVGFNKGYNFATWMNVFTPWTKMSNAVWFDLINSTDYSSITNTCGSCDDCLQSFNGLKLSKTSEAESGELFMYGLDFNDDNLNLVSKITSFGIRNKKFNFRKVKLYLLNAAASSDIMVTRLPYDCKVGIEQCAISNHGRDVYSISIDQFFGYVKEKMISEKKSPSHRSLRTSSKHKDSPSHSSKSLPSALYDGEFIIDILQIDAEGHDPAVLQGASQLILDHKIRCIVFEYHHLGLWSTVNLKDVVQEFSHMQYECFFEGQGRLWPITGTCWDPKYEFKFWSNVMCMLRTDPWYGIIQKYILRGDHMNELLTSGEIFRWREIKSAP